MLQSAPVKFACKRVVVKDSVIVLITCVHGRQEACEVIAMAMWTLRHAHVLMYQGFRYHHFCLGDCYVSEHRLLADSGVVLHQSTPPRDHRLALRLEHLELLSSSTRPKS